MRTINKIPVDVISGPGPWAISVLGGNKARVRAVGLDGNGLPSIWIECEIADDESDKLFFTNWTGYPAPSDEYHYCGVVVFMGIVGHIYEWRGKDNAN